MIQQITGSGTISWNPGAVEHRTDGGAMVYQFTPTATTTINAVPDGLPGQLYVFKFVTSGTTSYTTTFGTNFKTTATLASGTTDAKVFTVTFVSDGQTFNEVTRTAAM